MSRKSVLGKGLSSLIKTNSTNALLDPIGETEAPKTAPQVLSDVSTAPIEMIRANPIQPRKIFKETELEELSNSIKEMGVIQPLVVVEREDEEDGTKYLELVAGERRFRASKMAGLDKVPVVIKRATDKDKSIMAIIENVQRSDLNCVEEALAYYHLIDDYKLTQEEVAKKLGKTRSSVANFLRLLKLPREIIHMLQKEELSFGHGKVLASVKSESQAINLAKEAAQNNWSVRETENALKAPTAPKKKIAASDSDEWEEARELLEKRTGLHIKIKANAKGKGSLQIKFNNTKEFNQLFDRLAKL